MADLSIKLGPGVYEFLNQPGMLEIILAKLPPALATGFKAAAKDSELSLTQFIDQKKQELQERIPDELKFLVTRLREFDRQALSLVDYAKKGPANKNYQFQLSANASLLLANTPADALHPAPAFSLDEDDVLMGLTFSGSANFSATAKGTWSSLNFAINAGASLEHSLTFYGSCHKNVYGAQYLLGLQSRLADPTDLDAILAQLDAGGLTRVERMGLPAMSLGITVGIAPQIKQLAGSLPTHVKVGAQLTVAYTDSSAFKLLVEKNTSGNYVLDLQKSRKTTLSKGLRIGTEIRVVGLKDRLLEKVTQVLPEDPGIRESIATLDEIIDKVSEQSLKKQLRDRLVSEWPTGLPVIEFLIGDTNARKLADEVREELLESMTDIIDAQVDPLNQKATEAAKVVGDAIASRLGVTGQNREILEQYMLDVVESTLTDYQQALINRLDTFIGEQADKVVEVLQPWEFLGESVNNAVKAVSSRTTGRLSVIRDALNLIYGRYTTFRQQVLQVIREDLEEKFAINITSQKDRTSRVNSAVRLEFSQASDLSRELYRSYWNANIARATELFDSLASAPETVTFSGEYVSLLREIRTSTLNVNLFGFKYEAAKIFSNEAKVAINSNGFLVTARGAGELKERMSFLGESQTLQTTWHLDYLRDPLLNPPLSIKLLVTDEELKQGSELENFFAPFERAGLMRVGISDEVDAAITANGLTSVPDAKLTVHLVMRWQDWLRMVRFDREGNTVPNSWDAEAITDQYILLARKFMPGYVRDAENLMDTFNTTDFKPFMLFLGEIRNRAKLRRVLNRTSQSPLTSELDAWTLGRYIFDLQAGVPQLQNTWLRLVEALPESDEILTADQLEALRPQVFAVNKAVADVFDATTRQVNINATVINDFTTAGLSLIAANVELPNTFLSCTLESPGIGKLMFN